MDFHLNFSNTRRSILRVCWDNNDWFPFSRDWISYSCFLCYLLLGKCLVWGEIREKEKHFQTWLFCCDLIIKGVMVLVVGASCLEESRCSTDIMSHIVYADPIVSLNDGSLWKNNLSFCAHLLHHLRMGARCWTLPALEPLFGKPLLKFWIFPCV